LFSNKLQYILMCLSVWMCRPFYKSLLLLQFLWFSQNLAHVIYVPVHKKTVEEIFEILILKFLAIFLKF